MAYLEKKNTLISRPGYSGFGDVGDVLKEVGAGALTFFGSQQRAAGAAEALAQTNRDLIAAQQAQQGISTPTIVIGGVAAAAVLFIILRKKG